MGKRGDEHREKLKKKGDHTACSCKAGREGEAVCKKMDIFFLQHQKGSHKSAVKASAQELCNVVTNVQQGAIWREDKICNCSFQLQLQGAIAMHREIIRCRFIFFFTPSGGNAMQYKEPLQCIRKPLVVGLFIFLHQVEEMQCNARRHCYG